jgi:hypothetical protein
MQQRVHVQVADDSGSMASAVHRRIPALTAPDAPWHTQRIAGPDRCSTLAIFLSTES